MKNHLTKYFVLLIILVVIISSISFGTEVPLASFVKTYKSLKGSSDSFCYIIGKFPMTHISDSSIGIPEVVEKGLDVNEYSMFVTKIKIKNSDSGRTYDFDLKAVSGSNPAYYSEKKLSENTNDSYYVLRVPSGKYELTNLSSNLSLYQPNYSTFTSQILDVPVSRMINKTISFSTEPKQIVYIGDYNTFFITYICSYEQTSLYPFRVIKMELKDDFETFKTTFINGADEKTKAKLEEYEFVSILYQ